MRLLTARNFWMSYAGVKQSYEGPQTSYFRKDRPGSWLTEEILDIAGPLRLTDDPGGAPWTASPKRSSGAAIVAMHPGGTTDIQRVIMARRLGIGKRARARKPAASLHSADGASAARGAT